MKESAAALKARAIRISNVLRKIYGKKGTALLFHDPFELLVATVLSAQCTDDTVNRVAPVLFKRFRGPKEMAVAETEEVEKIIYQTGFYRNKTKNILALANALMAQYGGKVPETMEQLTALPGVGRKTANLVRAMAFGHPGLIVDTHFKRVSNRLGLVGTDDPTKIEHAIAELLPPDHWTEFSNSMIWHGRAICPARKPKCEECPVAPECDFAKSEGIAESTTAKTKKSIRG